MSTELAMDVNTATLNHRYEILSCIGRGSQGAVYEASDSRAPGVPVALKILGPASPSGLLAREFARLAELSHPNLAKVFDLGVVSHTTDPAVVPVGAAFFTGELVEGAPSDSWAASLPAAKRAIRVAAVAVEVARALAFLHANGLLHRDVKPSNILVPEEGRSRLIDLGLSRRLDLLDGVTAGTLGYMAPETLEGLSDARADLFALGATMAHLLSGRRPPLGWSADPDDPPADVDPELWSVVARLTMERPEDRYEDGAQAAIAVGRAMGHEILGEGREWDTLDAASDHEDRATSMSRGRSSSLVGRREELRSLLGWMESVMGGSGDGAPVAIVKGPAGVGKTRLVRTAVARYQVDRAMAGERTPGLVEGTAAQVARVLGADDGGGCADDLARNLARLAMGLPSPTIVAIDDGDAALSPRIVHWLIEEGRGEAAPVGVIVETVSGLLADVGKAADGALVVEAAPLRSGAEAALVRALGGPELSEGEIDSLRRKTGGLPLLTEAYVRAGLGGGRGGEIAVPEGDPGEVLATSALAALDDKGKAVAEAMAVLARGAVAEEIAEVAGVDSREAEEAVAAMESLGLVSRGSDGAARLLDVVAGALEGVIPEERRPGIHGAALDLLRRDPLADPGRIARHARAAGDLEVFASSARMAARRALEAGDSEGAARHLEGLLEVVEDRAERDRVALDLAGACRRTGRYPEAERVLTGVCSPPPSAAVRMELGSVLRLSGRPEEAREILAPLLGDAGFEAGARAVLARAAMDTGDADRAAELLRDVEPSPDPEAMTAGLIAAAGLLRRAEGDAKGAAEFFDAGLIAAREVGDTAAMARFNALGAMLFHTKGSWREAERGYSAALDLADRAGDRHGAATYAVNLAAVLTELGEFQRALETYRDGLFRLRIVGRSSELSVAGANYAQLLLRLGDRRGAARAVARAIEDAGEGSGDRGYALAMCVKGDVLLESRRPAEAISVLRESEEILAGRAADPTLAACRRHLAAALARDGDPAGAREWLGKAAASEGGDPRDPEAAAVALEIALVAGEPLEEPAGTLAEIIDERLEENGADPLVLGPMATLTRARLRMGRREEAAETARGLVVAEEAVRALVPSLHREPEGRYAKEVRLLDTNGMGAPAPGAAGGPGTWGWERLVRINTRLNSETRIGPLLDLIMDTALDVTGGQRGFLLVAREDGILRVRSARNMDRARIEEGSRDFSRSVAEKAYGTGEPVVTTDAQQDEQFMGAGSIMALGLRYVIAVPLLVKGVAKGTIYVDSRAGGRFDRNRLSLLEALADQAAIAITNNRLMAQDRRRRREIEKLNRQLERRLRSREGELQRIREDLARKTEDLETRYSYSGIIGRSPGMSRIFDLLDRIAHTDVPVVISGESGTGKELVAKAIHYNGPRGNMPFVAENCAAIPSALLESTLFGHVKGAFTGAVADREGLFATANGGTLFLDEIGDMPPEMQAKLLRVLQDGEVRPVGGGRPRKMDVRVLAASNMELAALVEEKRFREDLYYRLNVVQVHMPPLRERREDIGLLAGHFIEKHAQEERPRISNGALEALTSYRWPGNVRQLENEIMRALVLCDDVIEPRHLSPALREGGDTDPDDGGNLDMERRVDSLKRRLIVSALERSGGNRSEASRLLGVSRYGLQKMMERLGV